MYIYKLLLLLLLLLLTLLLLTFAVFFVSDNNRPSSAESRRAWDSEYIQQGIPSVSRGLPPGTGDSFFPSSASAVTFSHFC